MTREELIALAERVGVVRPRVLTLAELTDEILSRTARSDRDRARARGWLGRARDLLAGVVERGLHLPDVAQMLRTTPSPQGWPPAPPPLATLTLAEIYAAQGHLERAVTVLDEVLVREPDHKDALALRTRLAEQADRGRGRPADDAVALAPTADPAQEASSTPMAVDDRGAPLDELRAASAEAWAAHANGVAGVAGDADEPVTLRKQATGGEADEPPTLRRSSPPGAAPSIAPLAATPERYEVDEVVAIAVDPRTLYLYWEVRPATLARARARHPDGSLVVRVVGVTPTWDGPVVRTRDLRLEALYGDEFVRDVDPGSSVRVSVGWLAQNDFEPFAVGIELSAPHLAVAEPVAQEVGRWTAEGAPAAVGPSAEPSTFSAPSSPTTVGATSPDRPAQGLPARLREVALAELRTTSMAPAAPAAWRSSARGVAARPLETVASPERTVVLETWKVHRTGSSELVRELERTLLLERDLLLRGGNGAPGNADSALSALRFGGASELGRGGASELSRRG